MSREDKELHMKIAARGSIRNRLLVALLIGLALVWSLAGGYSAWQTRVQIGELLDANLAQSAMPLLHEIEEAYPEHAFSLFRYSSNVVFQIWQGGDKLLLSAKNAPRQRLSRIDTGFSNALTDNREWRVFGVWDESHRYLVQVGELRVDRRYFSSEVIEQLLQSLLLALPLFGLMVWFVVGRVLRPVARLSDEIARRDPKYLEPISAKIPREITPLAERLNDLLARVQLSLESERRFTSDAAHELRTPLAAVKSQLQVALGAVDSSQQKRALDNALLACDRATHRVEQMLTLARLEQDAWRELSVPVNLHALAAQVIAEVAPLAASRHIELALEGSAEITVNVHAGLWAVLLRNLLDNAVRYAPERTAVTVRTLRTDAGNELQVWDEGPGIPPEQIASALARFHRLDNADQSGSGLGLSIVARISDLYGATLKLDVGASGGGLCARVILPD
jgi:two-component system sensor histidine kinase QseC